MLTGQPSHFRGLKAEEAFGDPSLSPNALSTSDCID